MAKIVSRVLCAVALCAVTASAGVFTSEDFSSTSTMSTNGWLFINNSNPVGAAGWAQGNSSAFAAQSGAPTEFVGVGYGAVGGSSGAASAWLLSPLMTFSQYTVVTFYTRTETDNGGFADHMEVRASTAGGSSVGATSSSVGDFTSLLLDINPTLDPNGYPTGWTKYTLDFGALAVTGTGRIAFRYSVPDITTSGDYIGLDTMTASTPEPLTSATVLFGLGALAVVARRKRTRQ